MLSDFIEANLLSARIVPKRIANENGAICKLLVSESQEAFLILYRYHNKLDSEKLKKVLKEFTSEKIHEADSVEAERITGYKAEYLPPISIYGVRLLIDKKAAECSADLYFFTAPEETLIISPREIIEMNDMYSIVDITKD